MSTSNKLVWAAAFAGLLAGITLTSHRRREQERRTLRVKPEPLQTWEGEGGAVPLRTGRTAQQVTPPLGTLSGASLDDPVSGSGKAADDFDGPAYLRDATPL